MRPRVLVLLIAALAGSSGCASQHAMAPLRETGGCHATIGADGDGTSLRWMGPSAPDERLVLDRWCEAVGPAVVRVDAASSAEAATDELGVISWNVHVGGGDVETVVNGLRSGRFSGGRPIEHFVLLLQEAFRAGDAVPRDTHYRVGVPDAIRPWTGTRPRRDIVAVASRFGLTLLYVPSMRNGDPTITREDRGNAILSTLPLADPLAIELPFERQRRVALAATVQGRDTDGTPWSLIVSSVHLDNLAGLRHAWIITGPARRRQAQGLLAALPSRGAAVVAGDLNSWSGFDDAAYRELAARYPDATETDRRPTFGGLMRLDHLLFRLPPGWQAHTSRLEDRFGSDHYPVMGIIRFRGARE